MPRFFKVFIFLASFLFAVFFSYTALAQEISPADTQYGLDSSFSNVAVQSDRDIKGLIATIINITLGFLGIVAVILILYAGYMWMTAGGNQDQVSKAKLILRNAVIGLVIILSAWAIAAFVIRQLGGATGAGGGIGARCSAVENACVPDNGKCDQAQNLYCSDGCTCQLAGGGPGLGEDFKIKAFQTSHQGPTPDDTVYRCSPIVSVFNEMLNQTTVDSAWGNGNGDLKIVRIKDNDTVLDPPERMDANMQSAGNIADIAPKEADDKWPANGRFEIHIPKTIKGSSGRFLNDCLNNQSLCNDRGTYYSWEFNTTDADDVAPPSLMDYSYPPVSPEDQNVNRSITFSLAFSEQIRTISFIETIEVEPEVFETRFKQGSNNIIVEKIQNKGASGEIRTQVPLEDFYVRVPANEGGLYFGLKASHRAEYDNHAAELEPYQWYRITVQNITDLCGNPLSASPVRWYFKTNGVSAGVFGAYPPNGFQNTCPSSETFIQFRTSMYDIVAGDCAVGSGLVKSGIGISERSAFNVAPPGQEGGDLPAGSWDPTNPNKYCKIYEFTPLSNFLSVGATYNPKVSYAASHGAAPATFNQADDEWSFKVASPDKCAYPPYITSVNPEKGAWGQCVTIKGRHFGDLSGSPSPRSYSTLSLEDGADSAKKYNRSVELAQNVVDYWTTGAGKDGFNLTYTTAGWQNSRINADISNLPGVQGIELPPNQNNNVNIDITVKTLLDVDGDGTRETLWPSNTDQFWVNSSDYTGPCLDDIVPDDGKLGKQVTVYGRRLGGAGAGNKNAGDEVFFESAVAPGITPAPVVAGQWNPSPNPLTYKGETIKITVPGDDNSEIPAIDGDVKIKVGALFSNELDFDVSGEVGAVCSSTIMPACVANNDACQFGLECSPTTCKCQIPDRFEITQVTPINNCSEACPNAPISFTANKDILEPTGGLITRISMLKCTGNDIGCAQVVPSSVAKDINNNKKAIISINLETNKWYRVIIDGTLASDSNPSRNIYSGQFNYDKNSDGTIDSYSWKFHTRANNCNPNRIDLNPNSGILYENASYTYRARAFSPADSCSASGQELVLGAGFNWSDKIKTTDNGKNDCQNNNDQLKLSMNPIQSNATSTASVLAMNPGTEIPAWICSEHAGIIGYAPVTLKARCRPNVQTDCQTGSCQSNCNTQTLICDPKIHPNSGGFSPTAGEIGTWVTINGCYFGNDWGDVKIGGTDALPPNEALCGNTWTNTQIVAQDQSQGTVQVIRDGDGNSDTSSDSFTITQDIWPAICRATPPQEREGRVVDLKGHNFGLLSDFQNRTDPGGLDPSYGVIYASSTSPVLDKITDDVSENAGCPSGGWGPDHICIRVVQGAPESTRQHPGMVKVRVDATESAGYTFRVIGANSRPENAQDLYVDSYTPGKGNLACINMIIEVSFKGKLDETTLGYEPFEHIDAGSSGTAKLFVQRISDSAMVTGTTTVEKFSSKTIWRLYPDAGQLVEQTSGDPDPKYKIIIKGGTNGLRSETDGIIASNSGDACTPLLSGGDCEIGFNTVTSAQRNQCELVRLVIEPASAVFTCARDGCDGDVDNEAGHQRKFGAIGVNKMNPPQPAVPSSALLWTSSDETILSTAEPTTPLLPHTAPSELERIFDIHPKDGTSIIRAQAGAITGSTEARVFLCENPWPAQMSANGKPFNDTSEPWTSTTENPKTNFSTFYCRDRGEQGTEDDLPGLSMKCNGGDRAGLACASDDQCTAGGSCELDLIEFGANAPDRSVPGLIKEIFLTQPYSKACQGGDSNGAVCSIDSECLGNGKCVGEVDAIGIRAFTSKTCTAGESDKIGQGCVDNNGCGTSGVCSTNPDYFSIRAWYDNQSFTKGSPSLIKIDNFDGLQDGRTIYVSAINDTKGPEKTCIDGYPPKIGQACSVNDDCNAGSITYGICSTNPSIYKNIYLISMNDSAHQDTANIYNQLVKNWQFLANITNTDEEERLRRDLKRVEDGYYMAGLLNRAPLPVKLESGSFQNGLSLSTWPSWQAAMGTDFGASLPVDPINEINCLSHPNINQTTCFDPGKSSGDRWKFWCEIGNANKKSRFYLYKYLPDTRWSIFQFNLEYSTSNDWQNVFIGQGWNFVSSDCANIEYKREYPATSP